MSSVAYRYQWLADDADITGATDSTYTLVDADEGKTVQVRVSFTDDAGHEEALTSKPTDAVVAAEPAEPPATPTGLTAAASHDQVVLSWDDPQDASITGYVILRRNRATTAPGEFTELVADTGSAVTTYTDDSVAAETLYTYRIRAMNEHGVSERSRWARADTPAPPVPARAHGPDRRGVPRPGGPQLGRPPGRQHHRLRDPAAQPGRPPTPGEFTELVADTGSAANTYTDHERGGRHFLHLPHQGHQRARGERALPLGAGRHPGGAGVTAAGGAVGKATSTTHRIRRTPLPRRPAGSLTADRPKRTG